MNSQAPILIKIVNLVKALKKLEEEDFESDQCLECFKKIDNSFNEEKIYRVEVGKILVESNYPEISLKFLKYYTRSFLFENDKSWPCCFYLLRSIWNYSDVFNEIALASIHFIPILLDILSNELFSPIEEEDEKLFKLSLNILNNIAHFPETRSNFHQHQALKILKKLTNIENELLRVLVYLILAQIVVDNDGASEGFLDEIVESICAFVKESLKKDRRFKGISTSQYLDILAKLSVNKENKIKILECGMIGVLKSILNSQSSNDEQTLSLNLIWNLCFDEKISETIKKDKELTSLMNNLKNSSVLEEIQKRVAAILFTLNHFHQKREILSKKLSESNYKPKGHIMISFDTSSLNFCLNIKDELKSKKIQVWLNSEQKNSVAEIAEAIENASAILICVSERFYLSPSCRLEAEYASKLHKPIIPLILESEYSPAGWLGNILNGNKNWHKFTKYSFEQAFSTLFKELNRLIDEQKAKITNTPVSNNNAPIEPPRNNYKANNKLVNEWSISEVKQWLNTLNLSSWIHESEIFENINGELLKELHEIRQTAPDFYYNLMKTKFSKNQNKRDLNEAENFQLYDLLKFSSELNSLFKIK